MLDNLDNEYYDDDQGNSPQEKTYTQSELDKMISERLEKAKTNYETELSEYKAALDELDEFGYTGTPSEKKAAIKQYKEMVRNQNELEELQSQAEEEGLTPVLTKKIKELEDALRKSNSFVEEMMKEREAKKKEAEIQKERDTTWNKQVIAFEKEFPDVDLEALDKNTKFIKYIKGKSGVTLVELYKDFLEFVGETETETIKKIKTKDLRSTFGSRGNDDKSSGSYGLTDEQKKHVDEWNSKYPHLKMSYKEYAAKQKNI